ncbi:MAG: molybdenum cofactor synthesis domain-containing protein, partial [Ginsengibacter sp.]
DMLKPIDKNIQITDIKLEQKKGGKSDVAGKDFSKLKCAVVVCSDRISKGEKEDTAGKAIVEKLKSFGIAKTTYKIIADDFALIQKVAKNLVNKKLDVILFTGGTGLSKRDVTPDAILPLIEKEIPGIMEQARNYGQQRMPYAILSRGVSGFIKDTLVLTLPGSKKGAMESMDAIFPSVFHLFDLTHEEKNS